jgi:hypothetical protein
MSATMDGNLVKRAKGGLWRSAAHRGSARNSAHCVMLLAFAPILLSALAGCGSNASAPSAATDSAPAAPTAETKPAAPAVPEEEQAAARALLGSEVQVLLIGDLAKNGNEEVLAANVLPKTPTNTIPGTVVSRAIIVEKVDGKWTEVLHVDEHLKNPRGLLGGTPREPVTGWRLQYEQDPVQGLQLYFTPEKTGAAHVLPIGVRFNPKAKRYQSTDSTFERFLGEAAQLGDTPRSTVRSPGR